MRRKHDELTAQSVAKLKEAGLYLDGGGLYLQVSPAVTKSWVFRYALRGRERHMGLGSALDVTLAQARGKAAEARALLGDGIDPLEARKARDAQAALAAARNITFAECAEAYIEEHRAGWKNAKHAAQWENTLATYAEPVIGALPVQDVDAALVLKILRPVWSTKPETAARLRARLEAVLDWATASTYRTGDNPARWKGHLEKLLPPMGKKQRAKLGKFKHHAALPYLQIGAFVADLRTREGVAAKALEFAILTACRTGEAIGARQEEFDLDAAIWTVPAERMKAGREHRIPLSPRAVALVREQPAGEYVFHGAKKGDPLSNGAMLQLLERMGRGDLTVHGFRSTFRTWAAERTGYPREVCELALAHTTGDATELAYKRTDLMEKRAQLMMEWSRFCDMPTPAAQVIALRA
jgi:integrase